MNSTTSEPGLPPPEPVASPQGDAETARNAIVDASMLRLLAERTALSAPAIDRARELIGLSPTATDWQRALTRIGAIGAGACASAALVCFIAYNWDALGRWFRFALFEGALVVGVLIAVMFAHKPLVHKAASLFALFALGGLLAFTGQTYQTGADSYQLFVTWALLALPWIFAVRWWGYTLVWFLVVQLAITGWANHVPWVRDMAQATWVFVSVIGVNALFAIGFYAARRFDAFDQRWLWRLAVLAVLSWATFCSFMGSELLSMGTAERAFQFTRFDLIAALVVAATFLICSRIGRESFDATILYAAWASGIFILLRWLLSAFDYVWRDSGGLFFLSAALLAGGVTVGTVIIRNLSKQHATRVSSEGAVK